MAESKHKYGILGQPAPEISVDYWIDKDGEPTSFGVMENRGKWVLLKCFQDWCPGCHSNGFPTLKKFSDAFWDHPRVAIAGIQTVFEGFSSNTQDDVRKLQLKYELPITMGHDPGDPDTHEPPHTMRMYRTGGTPWLILIAPDGTVVFNDFHAKPDKLIEFVLEQVA
ncbi:MAG: peroxiredoxin family protein [Gammaproteobacteria bacterium]